uniref:Tripartite motif-containing protein 3 n=1 Tax=Magallana gigas TaxID=29159 RepID=K1Q0W7_MAGGI
MDPHSTGQDVPRCDLCESAIIHSYCEFCHFNLCKPCIGEHISDGYDKHKIVPFQERRSTLIYPKCGIHQNKTCELQCKDCNISVCSTCTASKQHKGHNFVEVTEVYNEKKETIKKDTKELENLISPTYEEISLDLEKQLANLNGGYEKLTTTMSKQGEQWHREIDFVINKMKSEIGEIKIEELITSPEEWTPYNLSVTSTGDLLVTMFSDDDTQSKVVRYSGSTEKQTIQFDDDGKPLYSGNDYDKYITENRNHDICVTDWEAGVVVVVNQDGKLRWRYTGHPSATKNKPFKPIGITTDSQSHILTADSYNHCIHILDQNGQFLRYIDNCDLKDPYGLCVDNTDNLFVCEFYKGNVKKIKYLK